MPPAGRCNSKGAGLTTSAETFRRANLRFVLSHPAPFIAFGFGIGLIQGTVQGANGAVMATADFAA